MWHADKNFIIKQLNEGRAKKKKRVTETVTVYIP
jgi:hypothetical protein